MKESAWLIERDKSAGKETAWLQEFDHVGMEFFPIWTQDANRAVRFSREEDATIVVRTMHPIINGAAVTEHIWMDRAPAAPEQAEESGTPRTDNWYLINWIDGDHRKFAGALEIEYENRLAAMRNERDAAIARAEEAEERAALATVLMTRANRVLYTANSVQFAFQRARLNPFIEQFVAGEPTEKIAARIKESEE